MKLSIAKLMLLSAAAIAIITALSHSACIFLGPQCYAFQLAPEVIVQSAEQGTWLAPVGTLIASFIFLLFAAYAMSAAGVIRRLPIQTGVVYTIAGLCLVRGVLGIQLWIRRPELLTDFAVFSNWVWFAAGLCYLVGYRLRAGN